MILLIILIKTLFDMNRIHLLTDDTLGIINKFGIMKFIITILCCGSLELEGIFKILKLLRFL